MNLHDHTPEDLQETPWLASLPKSAPKAAPAGYFETFADRMRERIEEDQLLEGAPMLRRAGRKSPFLIPDGYFERMHGQLVALIARDSQPTTVTPRTRLLYPTFLAVAVAAAMLLLFSWRGLTSESLPRLPQMTATELLTIVDIDEDLIFESFRPEDLNTFDHILSVKTPKGEAEYDEWLEQLDLLEESDLQLLEEELLQLEEADWF